MNLREVQAPLKERYKQEPDAARITLRAEATQDTPVSCSVDLGRATYAAQAHAGVGGAGTGACSGDLLLGALSACAQITCQMVAAAAGIPVGSLHVAVEGDLDLRGTLVYLATSRLGSNAFAYGSKLMHPIPMSAR